MISEAIQTVSVISIAIISVFVVGLCVASLAVKCLKISCTSEQLWVATPLIGTGAIILICQNLLYLDVRIPYSTILIWVSVAIVAIASAARGHFSISNIPWKLMATGVAVYVVHASGLLVSGASNYYGYGWGDMYNYVAQAQFFIDFPFSTLTDSHEYVRIANVYKLDRIGQSVLHAFITSSSGADAQQTFGATILLSPMLIFFSIFLLSTSLGIQRRFAYPAAVAASLSPAIASVHLECFFSQAMVMPFVFLWPLAVSRLKSNPDARSIFAAGLVFAVTSAIYTEVIPAMVLIAAIVLAISAWTSGGQIAQPLQKNQIRGSWKGVLVASISLCLVVLVGLIANLGYFKGTMVVIGRTTRSGVLDYLYPWAFKPEGLARLWIGHQSPSLSGWILYSIAIASAITILAAIVYVLSIYRENGEPDQLFSALVISMPLAPLLLTAFTKNVYPYQFVKLLLIVWPLIIFLAACGIAEWISKFQKGRGYIYFQITLVCVCLALTNRIAYASAKPSTTANSARGASHLLIDENFKQMRHVFDGLEGKQIYIWWYDKALWDGSWRGRWLAYFARKNLVWSMKLIDSSVPGEFFESLPENGVKVPAIGISWKEVPVGTKVEMGSSLVGTDPFWLYQLNDVSEVRRLDKISREYGVISRSMQLSVDKDTDSATWYPLWVVGQPGSATLITVNFGKAAGVRLRYDQWGSPDVSLNLGGTCAGKELLVSIKVEQFKRKLTVKCNEVVEEREIPSVEHYLSLKEPLGVNGVANWLEGKYPLAKTFPGKVVELPEAN